MVPKMTLLESLRSSFIVACISGIAGLVMVLQDIIIASHFATGGAADAYQLASTFPLLAVNVFAGGTLLVILVPLLTQYAIKGWDVEAARVVKWSRRALGWALLVICGIWALAYPHVVALVAKGFSAETADLSIHLLWLLIPVLFFSGLAGIDVAILNSRRCFIFISTLPAFLPAGVILGVLMLEAQMGIYGAAIGLVFGSALQWLASRSLAAPLLQPVDHSAVPATMLRQLVRDYATSAASAALLAGIFLTDTFMASSLTSGSAAVYGYAVRPVVLLLAFITSVIGNVVLPFFSLLVANEDWPALKKQAFFWFGLLGLGSLPVVALWHTNVAEIVALLYQRGAFGVSDTARVAAVQQVFLLQIPFYLVAMIGWRVMNSLSRHKASLIIVTVCFLANLAANLWLAPRLGLQGIAWGTNLAFALWAMLIAFYLLRLRGSHAALTAHGRAAPSLTRGLS